MKKRNIKLSTGLRDQVETVVAGRLIMAWCNHQLITTDVKSILKLKLTIRW